MIKISVGDEAPHFTGVNEQGLNVSLQQYKGKKIVLYFYPADGTPTCTVQACNIRDNFAALSKLGVIVIGISPDSAKSHTKFISKHQLPFTLIADENHSIMEQYGVWGQKTTFGKTYMGVIRTTFIINEKQKIVHIIEKPKSKLHSQEIIEVLAKL
jgi:thioredoxin-dependent peroxiredoxin